MQEGGDIKAVFIILADKIRENFNKFRELFRKYEKNIEMVDP